MEGNLPFWLCFALYLRPISKYKPPEGAYTREGDLTEGFLRYEFGALVFGGAYTWRGLFSEFYGNSKGSPRNVINLTETFRLNYSASSDGTIVSN